MLLKSIFKLKSVSIFYEAANKRIITVCTDRKYSAIMFSISSQITVLYPKDTKNAIGLLTNYLQSLNDFN